MNNNILDDEKQLEYINKKLVKFLEKRLDILNKNKTIDSLLIDKKMIDVKTNTGEIILKKAEN